MSIGATISNRFSDFKLLELSQTTDHPDKRGPYMVAQTGSAPGDPAQRECTFALTKRGTWLHHYILFMLPQDVRDEIVVFETVAEVMDLAEGLVGTPEVETIESLGQMLHDNGFQPEAGDRATEVLLEEIRQAGKGKR